jgi:hypothetical protein
MFKTDISKHRYSGIARAALEMAYDNGGVNRDRPERVTIEELDYVLANINDESPDVLGVINDWLVRLSDEDLVTAVAGEHSEVQELMKRAPLGTAELLNSIFDGSRQ